MKTKKLLFLLPVLAFLGINPAKAQLYMRIHQSDGTVLEIAIADIQKLTLDLATAIQQHPEVVKQLLKLNVFPNPAKESITLDYSLQEEGHVVIEIYNLQGMLIEIINQGIFQPGDYNYQLNTMHLASGTYMCRVRQNNVFVTQRIVVKH